MRQMLLLLIIDKSSPNYFGRIFTSVRLTISASVFRVQGLEHAAASNQQCQVQGQTSPPVDWRPAILPARPQRQRPFHLVLCLAVRSAGAALHILQAVSHATLDLMFDGCCST